MIYSTDDDENDVGLSPESDSHFNNNPNTLVTAINRLLPPTPTNQLRHHSPVSNQYPPLQSTPNRSVSVQENSAGLVAPSYSLPTSPTSHVGQRLTDREAAYLAKISLPDEFSHQAIAFSRELLLPHLSDYPVLKRIQLLTDITCGCKDFSRLEHELPIAILETVNDAFDSTSVTALSPSLMLLQQALRYNIKAFSLSGAFPLLGLTLAKLFLIFKDAKVFDHLVEISDIVVKRWILADMGDNLKPFLQAFFTALGRFWPGQPPQCAQQLIRTLINSCHSVVAINSLFDCAQGNVLISDDPYTAILGALSTIRLLLTDKKSTPVNRPMSPAERTEMASMNETAFYSRKAIYDSALPVVSELLFQNPSRCRQPKIFIEVCDLLIVVANLQKPARDSFEEKNWWLVVLFCIEELNKTLNEMAGHQLNMARSSSNNPPVAAITEPFNKFNSLLLCLLVDIEQQPQLPHFEQIYRLLCSPTPILRSTEVITKISNYFFDHLLIYRTAPAEGFLEIRNFLNAFYVREQRQNVKENILAGLCRAFAKQGLVTESVVSVVIDLIFNGNTKKPRPLITDTSSAKSAQHGLNFIKQLFLATRPARNRYFFIGQAMNILFTVGNAGQAQLVELLSRQVFAIIIANMSDSLTCTGPVFMNAVLTISSELSRRFEAPNANTTEMLVVWRPTLLRFLCLCSALDANSLGLVICDRHFVEQACSFEKIEDLLEQLCASSNLVLNTDRVDMILLPNLKWNLTELSVPVIALRLLAQSLKLEKDPVAFKCFVQVSARFFAKRRVLQVYASPVLHEAVNELIELLCKCAATSLKRLTEQQQYQMKQQQPELAGQTSPQQSGSSKDQPRPSPYDLHTIFRAFLLVPALDFAIESERRAMFFQVILKSLKSPCIPEAIDCLTLCLAHMSTSYSQQWLERVTVELSKILSSELFAPNVMLLMELIRIFVKRNDLEVTSNSFLAVFSLIVSFANPCRFNRFDYSSIAFNTLFAWYLDLPINLRSDLGSYVLKQLKGYRSFSDKQANHCPSAASVCYYDEMTELTRDVVTEHNSRRASDFEPGKLHDFESAPTWFLENDRVISVKKASTYQKDGSVSVLVRSPSSVIMFQLQRGHSQRTILADEKTFNNHVVALMATFFGSSTALSLRKPSTPEADRALKNFDLILPFQKFKVTIFLLTYQIVPILFLFFLFYI